MTQDHVSQFLGNASKWLDDVKFNDWTFRIGCYGHSVPYLWINAQEGVDNVTGLPFAWNSRKWMLSKHMTKDEVIQTAFKATMTAMEHEVREQFKYKGVTVFDPHYDLDKLVALRSSPDALSMRAPMPTSTPPWPKDRNAPEPIDMTGGK